MLGRQTSFATGPTALQNEAVRGNKTHQISWCLLTELSVSWEQETYSSSTGLSHALRALKKEHGSCKRISNTTVNFRERPTVLDWGSNLSCCSNNRVFAASRILNPIALYSTNTYQEIVSSCRSLHDFLSFATNHTAIFPFGRKLQSSLVRWAGPLAFQITDTERSDQLPRNSLSYHAPPMYIFTGRLNFNVCYPELSATALVSMPFSVSYILVRHCIFTVLDICPHCLLFFSETLWHCVRSSHRKCKPDCIWTALFAHVALALQE